VHLLFSRDSACIASSACIAFMLAALKVLWSCDVQAHSYNAKCHEKKWICLEKQARGSTLDSVENQIVQSQPSQTLGFV